MAAEQTEIAKAFKGILEEFMTNIGNGIVGANDKLAEAVKLLRADLEANIKSSSDLSKGLKSFLNDCRTASPTPDVAQSVVSTTAKIDDAMKPQPAPAAAQPAASQEEDKETPEGIAGESPGLEKAQQDFSNAAKTFLSKLRAIDSSRAIIDNPNMKTSIEKIQQLADGHQPLPDNNEIVNCMQMLRGAYLGERRAAGADSAEVKAHADELDGIINKAREADKNATEAARLQRQKMSGDPTQLRQETISVGSGLASKFDVLIDDQNKSVQAQKTVFKRTAFNAVLKAAVGEKGVREPVIKPFSNITLIPPINRDMLARRYSATKRKYVKRRFESIMACLKNKLNPRSEITAIYSHLTSSQRAALKVAMADYDTKREEFIATGKSEGPAYKPTVETRNKATDTATKTPQTLTLTEKDARTSSSTTTPAADAKAAASTSTAAKPSFKP